MLEPVIMSIAELSSHFRRANSESDDQVPSSTKTVSTHTRRTAELMHSRGRIVGYDEPVPPSITAFVIEEGRDGIDVLTKVDKPQKAKLLELFSAAEHRDRVIGVKLIGQDRGEQVEQTIWENGNFKLDSDEVVVHAPGRSLSRSSSADDKSTFLPAGFYTGTR